MAFIYRKPIPPRQGAGCITGYLPYIAFYFEKTIQQFGIKVFAPFLAHGLQGFLMGTGLFINPLVGQGVIYINDRHQASGQRYVFPFHPAGIAGAVILFMMSCHDLNSSMNKAGGPAQFGTNT